MSHSDSPEAKLSVCLKELIYRYVVLDICVEFAKYKLAKQEAGFEGVSDIIDTLLDVEIRSGDLTTNDKILLHRTLRSLGKKHELCGGCSIVCAMHVVQNLFEDNAFPLSTVINITQLSDKEKSSIQLLLGQEGTDAVNDINNKMKECKAAVHRIVKLFVPLVGEIIPQLFAKYSIFDEDFKAKFVNR